MESTGVYWKAIYLELEEAGLHPELINPRHFHSAEEGRKTDKTDAKWLANLARLGLYRASFVPEEPMRTLRLFVVATKKLVEGRKADKNRLTKILAWIFKKAAPLNGGSRFFHTRPPPHDANRYTENTSIKTPANLDLS